MVSDAYSSMRHIFTDATSSKSITYYRDIIWGTHNTGKETLGFVRDWSFLHFRSFEAFLIDSKGVNYQVTRKSFRILLNLRLEREINSFINDDYVAARNNCASARHRMCSGWNV